MVGKASRIPCRPFMSGETGARVSPPGGVGCGTQPTRKSVELAKSSPYIPLGKGLGDVRPRPAIFGLYVIIQF